jgi:hypothetical protein
MTATLAFFMLAKPASDGWSQRLLPPGKRAGLTWTMDEVVSRLRMWKSFLWQLFVNRVPLSCFLVKRKSFKRVYCFTIWSLLWENFIVKFLTVCRLNGYFLKI